MKNDTLYGFFHRKVLQNNLKELACPCADTVHFRPSVKPDTAARTGTARKLRGPRSLVLRADDAAEDAGPAISGSTSEHPLAAHKGKRGKESEQHVQGVHDLPAKWFMGGVVLTGEEWRRRLGDSVVEANLRTQEYICLRYFLCT